MVTIDREICIGCKACAEDCIAYNIVMEDGKANIKKDCLKCGHCISICPVNAVAMDEYDMEEVEEYEEETFHIPAPLLLHTIQFRRSIRNYKAVKVEQEKLEQIVQAGRYTATAKNMQDCCFVLVQEKLDLLKELVWDGLDERFSKSVSGIPKEWLPYVAFNRRRKSDASNDYLFRNAPAVVFVTSQYPLDAGLAAQNMELMAVSQGLGMLFNGYLARAVDADADVKKWLGIEEQEVRACMLLGYPAVSYKRTAPRREANIIWK